MLIIKRTIKDKILFIKDSKVIATVTVTDISGKRVHLGFEAKQDVVIYREELYDDSDRMSKVRHEDGR